MRARRLDRGRSKAVKGAVAVAITAQEKAMGLQPHLAALLSLHVVCMLDAAGAWFSWVRHAVTHWIHNLCVVDVLFLSLWLVIIQAG